MRLWYLRRWHQLEFVPLLLVLAWRSVCRKTPGKRPSAWLGCTYRRTHMVRPVLPEWLNVRSGYLHLGRLLHDWDLLLVSLLRRHRGVVFNHLARRIETELSLYIWGTSNVLPPDRQRLWFWDDRRRNNVTEYGKHTLGGGAFMEKQRRRRETAGLASEPWWARLGTVEELKKRRSKGDGRHNGLGGVDLKRKSNFWSKKIGWLCRRNINRKILTVHMNCFIFKKNYTNLSFMNIWRNFYNPHGTKVLREKLIIPTFKCWEIFL